MVITLDHLERSVGKQQLVEHNGARDANAFAVQVELLNGVIAQGDERDVAEDGEHGMLQHGNGQRLSSIASDVILADTAQA